ncbi:MAG: thioredoxin domain-containing protein [Dehalococcoidia bacterium]|nr:thioredoxin domain-containing protein [Dehalococcoidia bacterium]
MPNRLINESSPYLQQHAQNPVDWFPWGDEALERARREDKPILLSIGYSACHWCHVMEHESFEDPETARMMNQHFVSIKVDREERPDLDAIYMQTVQALTGRGGWPLTVFLTPDQKPFFGGTYFPPEDRHGIPGFRRVLKSVADFYANRRAEVTQAGDSIAAALRKSLQPLPPLPGTALPTADTLTEAFQVLASAFDSKFGGFGPAPKFPQPMVWEFLLAYASRTGDQLPLAMTELTLERMARAGMYDQLGGGFHRYATDEEWLVPHFEKMLYDNALLARLYLHAYQLTGHPLHRRVVTETLDYLLREMLGAEGQFYSSQDADSEGVEGKFYVWDFAELQRSVSGPQRDVLFRHYGVREGGNWEGHTILAVATPLERVSKELGLPLQEAEAHLAQAKASLLARRARRVPPATDQKALTAWNALALSSLAEAGAALGRDDYLAAARTNAAFLLSKLRPRGRLLRTYRDGAAKLNGYLEDYAFLVDALLALHAATLEPRWLRDAVQLAREMLELFWSDVDAAFYDVGRDHELLLVRPREVFDNAIPSGAAMATSALLKLAVLTGDRRGDRRLAEPALASLNSLQHGPAQHPNGFGHWLCALAFYLDSPREIALVGPASHPNTASLLRAVHQLFLPHKVVAGYDPAQPADASLSPLLEDKGLVNGLPAAYVCENYTCQQAVTTPSALREQLLSRVVPAGSGPKQAAP